MVVQAAPNQQKWPPWYLIARAEIGVKEVPGGKDHPRIIEYLKATSIPAAYHHDETAWCSAFVNWCMREAGFKGTGLANARSWLQWGEPLTQPRIGCITVFSADGRGPKAGHVAFFVDSYADKQGAQVLRVLGGNQHNEVCDAPYAKARLLGYRWPHITAITSQP